MHMRNIAHPCQNYSSYSSINQLSFSAALDFKTEKFFSRIILQQILVSLTLFFYCLLVLPKKDVKDCSIMLNFRIVLIMFIFFISSFGITSRIEEKDNIIKFWKERTLYNFMAIVSTDLLRYASSSDRALFKGCLTYSGTDTYQYSRCLGPLIRKNRRRYNQNIVYSPKRLKYGSNNPKTATIDLNSYCISLNKSQR